ncbi:SIS domain-containing protein [Paenibacillus sp. J2TS4]|uniref:SIS domain-containing protein n=1 Tax=Paenibacillus sp. J2TS4 TaxID=2807194 RepID=UPI001B03ACAB|nr:SIS domain-containing protein [Paenibacillus sp. J2TS4]GIP32730.1 glucosamine--fructose-6-phosphate aminotransferase [Paenibacillus sp. J2TS4]
MEFGKFTYPEISAQHEAIRAALVKAEQSKAWIDKYIANQQFDEVIFIGSGSSFYQAQTMAATFRKWMGRDASAWPSSEIFLFRDQAAAAGRQYLLVGVSRSGESTEVIVALDSVKDLSNWTICGITCYADSKLGQMAESLVSELGQEKSTVMTKSFSSMTYMMQAAIAIGSGKAELLDEIRKVAELDEQVVQAADGTAKAVAPTKFSKYVYLGMGAYFGLAQEACLKIKEMSYVWTESFGTLEFRHGPKSIVDQNTFLCVLVSEQARSYELKVAEEMKAYGAHVMLITASKGEDTAFADTVFEVGGRELSDEARSVLYLPVLQYLGYYTALNLGVDPDSPRNLTQVVKL